MPASPKSPGTAGSIVLVEEYGALAVAIGSALKKFAPGFATRTVRSLDDAESAMATAKPDLLVIDFDPPHPGALEFFARLKSTAPSTRVLVIAAAPLNALAENRVAAGAFEFVEKPFDLASLGAGVAPLIPNAGASRRAATVRDLGVRDLIPLQCLAGATGVLKIDAPEGRSGEIHFNDGQIWHAETIESDGVEALAEMLTWRAPRFKQPKRRPRIARSIEGNWATVLLETAASVQAGNGEPAPVAEPQARQRANDGGGKKVVVIDDTEMLLVFVEDILATADPTLEIFTAGSGSEGVERVAAIKPALVLLDYSLPDFNGDEVCQRLLRIPETAKIPIIMMSGHVPEMAASALRFENIVATVAKPFLSEALVEVVMEALANPAQFAVRPAAPVALMPVEETPTVEAPKTPTVEPEKRSNGHRRAPDSSAPPPEPSSLAAKPPPSPSTPSAFSTPPASISAPAVAAAPPIPPAAIQAPAFNPASTPQAVAVAPPPPTAMLAPMPRPMIPRSPSSAVAPQRVPMAASMSAVAAALTVASAATPARLATATGNGVVVSLAMEVLAIQFSSALQMAAIRARPVSRTISLHVEAGAVPSMSLPDAGFELGAVDLDARGQMHTVRLLPTAQRIGEIPAYNAFPVGAVSVLPANGGKAIELTPGPAAPMMLLLSAPFELAGVELSPSFGVSSLVLKARGGEIRVSLHRDSGGTGAAFKTAQVLLNRSAQIAEILLDSVA